LVLGHDSSGIYPTNVSCLASGVAFENDKVGGVPPHYVEAHNVLADTAQIGAGYYFDASLSTYPFILDCSNCWAAGSSGSGVVIAGGVGITFTGGRVRGNNCSGFLISGASSGGHNITGVAIQGNNISNASGCHGINVSSTTSGSNVFAANNIGNDIDVGGYQRYGINIATGGGSNTVIAGNSMVSNVTGAINSGAYAETGINITGNTPSIPDSHRTINSYLQVTDPTTTNTLTMLGYNSSATGSVLICGTSGSSPTIPCSMYGSVLNFGHATGISDFIINPFNSGGFYNAFVAQGTCSSSVRGLQITVQGPPDHGYVCVNTTGSTYAWVTQW
jgi:hypothetical protein